MLSRVGLNHRVKSKKIFVSDLDGVGVPAAQGRGAVVGTRFDSDGDFYVLVHSLLLDKTISSLRLPGDELAKNNNKGKYT